MEDKIYTLDEIEFVYDLSEPSITKQDLREEDNSELYMAIQRTYEFNELFQNSSSLEILQKRIDSIFQYTSKQWEYVEVIFEDELNELYKIRSKIH